MKNHSTWEQMLAHYRDLDERRRRELDEHVAGCEACMAQLAAYRRMDEEIAGMMQHRKSLVLHSRRDEQMRAEVYAAFDAEGRGWNAGRLPALLGSLAGIAALLVLTAGLVWTFRAWPDEMPEVASNPSPRLTATIAPTFTPPAPIVIVPSPPATMTPAPTITAAPTQAITSVEPSATAEAATATPEAIPTVTTEPGRGGGSGTEEAGSDSEGWSTPQPLAALPEEWQEIDIAPNGLCVVGKLHVRMVSELGPYETSLHVLNVDTGQSWVASESGYSGMRQHLWLENGQLLWVGAGGVSTADCSGENRRDLPAPEKLFALVGVGANSVAVVLGGEGFDAGGGGTVWRVDLAGGVWDRVPDPAADLLPAEWARLYTVPALSDDGASAFLMGPGYQNFLSRLPLALGEPPVLVTRIEPVQPTGADGFPPPPAPLEGSPYWTMEGYITERVREVWPVPSLLLDSRDGTLVTVAEAVGNERVIGGPMVSPDGRWVAAAVRGEGEQADNMQAGFYIAPLSDLRAGRIVPGESLVAWQSDPAAVFVLKENEEHDPLTRVPLEGGEPEEILWPEGFPSVAATSSALFIMERNLLFIYGANGEVLTSTVLPALGTFEESVEGAESRLVIPTLRILRAEDTRLYFVAGGPDEATRDQPHVWMWDVAPMLTALSPPVEVTETVP
jgi:hypothetical protein